MKLLIGAIKESWSQSFAASNCDQVRAIAEVTHESVTEGSCSIDARSLQPIRVGALALFVQFPWVLPYLSSLYLLVANAEGEGLA